MGFEELRGSFLWGLNICVRREDKEGTDQRLVKDICTGQEDRGGYKPDAGCIRYVGTGNMEKDKAWG